MTAQDAFNQELQAMQEKLAKLQAKVFELEKLNIRGNWGFVGTAKEVNNQLQETLDFIR